MHQSVYERAWVASIPHLTNTQVRALTSVLPNVSDLLSLSVAQLERHGVPRSLAQRIVEHRRNHRPHDIERWCIATHTSILVDLPPLLKEIPDPPTVLYVRGTIPDWERLCIAVVGTRQITEYGTKVTASITRQLIEKGCIIISGFMYGVDAVAHETALAHDGTTVGVLGFGFDFMYPETHRALASAMIESGNCLITEFAPWQSPTRWTFPRRNRIVSGLSQAIVVTEAARKSGTKITVTFALEQGRDVFAVPGPIDSPFSDGTKELINSGATLVTSGDDILEELGF